jgi:hypothetical protein
MTILEEAQKLINGDRAKAYGDAEVQFRTVANLWGEIVGHRITAKQVPLMMIALKLVRENNKHSRDNLVDIAGYAGLLEKITEPRKK